MTAEMSRRKFIACAALGATAPLAHAVEPPKRTGPPRLKLSIAAYSYRQLLTRKQDAMTLDGFLEKAAELDLEGVELTSYYFRDTSPAYLRHLRSRAFLLGLDVSGTAIGNDFAHPPGPARDSQLAKAKRWIELAETLGAPVVRIFAGHKKRGQTDAEAHKLIVEAIEECCEHAGKHGVFLALENHGGPTSTADGLLKIVRDVKSPWFGVNLDTGNFRAADPYADIAAAAPYAITCHVKVEITAGGKRRPADFRRLVRILAQAGYRGYLAIEYEAREDPLTAIPRHVAALREAIGSL